MKRLILIAGLAAAMAVSHPVQGQAGKPVDDASLGLAKGSVFDTATPQPFVLDGKGAQGAARAAYGAPPLVPHAVDEYLPIGVDSNDCVDCHDKPGAKKAKRRPVAIPATHYGKAAGAAAGVAGDYYNCMLCHAAAANVKDLVTNSAPKPAR
jgi:nitrate reductase (cytochrome), electron transfer subunit